MFWTRVLFDPGMGKSSFANHHDHQKPWFYFTQMPIQSNANSTNYSRRWFSVLVGLPS